MQFSESWLRSFVDPALSSAELAHVLTMGGLEVEELRPVAADFDGVVVGLVRTVTKHPNADRLSVCQVDVGTGTDLNIVCGAPNVAPGIRVPCALIGAQLPGEAPGAAPFVIKRTAMRGVDSEGMLCSARELKLSEDHSGLMILDGAAPIGAAVRELLDLDDNVLTLKLTLTGAPLVPLVIEPIAPTHLDHLPVKVLAPELCGRFSGRIVHGVNARAATPSWMKERLARSGQRSVSALVDISNYVMLELGRPTHVFDLARIHGGLEVRWGRMGESLELLNGATIELDADVGVIADEQAVESLAGIMGGEATAVTLDTTDIYLEAAFWWPAAVQGRAKRFKFSTDAAHRFERGVDPATTVLHIERITRLILDICGGSAGPIDDQILGLPERRPVRVRVARVHKVIGVPIERQAIAEIFARLNFIFTETDDEFLVTAPSYRFDIAIEEDLIEEVARCWGYENIPVHLPIARHSMMAQPEERRSIHNLRHLLADSGYHEMLNYAFVEEQWESDFAGNSAPIRLINPIADPLAVMRSSLIGSLVANLRYNLNRKHSRIRVFEISKVFYRDPETHDGPLQVAGLAQPVRVAALAYGPAEDEQWGERSRNVDYFDVKLDLEELLAPRKARFVRAEHPALHPGRSARVELDGRVVGWLGELHPRWLQQYELPQAPVVFEIDAEALLARPLPSVAEISKFPAVTRDLSLVMDGAIEAQSVLDEIEAVRRLGTGAGLIQSVDIFDEYRGKGLKSNEKSLAFRFRLQDTHQTLSDEVVEGALAAVTTALRDKFGASPRS
jgi:phenylalanyl-tRNA synthetase beta chain